MNATNTTTTINTMNAIRQRALCTSRVIARVAERCIREQFEMVLAALARIFSHPSNSFLVLVRAPLVRGSSFPFFATAPSARPLVRSHCSSLTFSTSGFCNPLIHRETPLSSSFSHLTNVQRHRCSDNLLL